MAGLRAGHDAAGALPGEERPRLFETCSPQPPRELVKSGDFPIFLGRNH
jgi:hypothetical protein